MQINAERRTANMRARMNKILSSPNPNVMEIGIFNFSSECGANVNVRFQSTKNDANGFIGNGLFECLTANPLKLACPPLFISIFFPFAIAISAIRFPIVHAISGGRMSRLE